MEGKEGTTPPPPPAFAAAISSVFGSDILLREILLRLDFPTYLVRAAAISKRWLRLASDPAFLDLFRARHPARLLGFYLTTRSFSRLEFVPAPPPHNPPELAAVLRRCGDFDLPLDDEQRSSLLGINGMYCHNGRLFFSTCYGDGKYAYGVYRPLHPERGIHVIPDPPKESRHDIIVGDFFARDEGGGELSSFWFRFACSSKGKATATLYMLRDHAWRMQTSAKTKIPGWPKSGQKLRSFHVIGDRVYLVVTTRYILVFDWTSSSFSTIEFPKGVDDGQTLLSRASDSDGLYLVNLIGLKLSIWRRMTDNNGSVGDWMLLDTICLRDMCADLRMPGCKKIKDDDGCNSVVTLKTAGHNAEFVFLEINACVFYLDVRSKALHKCCEVTDENVRWVRPFMMIWPPTFPAVTAWSAMRSMQGRTQVC
ncbi:unnamed protein product [Urochloa humidicola]